MTRPILQKVLIFVILLLVSAAPLPAQDTTSPPSVPDDAYQSQRKFALALLDQQKYMEGLPVFESLAKQNPKDADVIFGWGACLLNHSATVSNPDAARKERIQARQLLVRSKDLGKTGNLLMNLLEMMPEDGSVAFSSASEADAAMRAGEAAFAKNDYDQAIKDYSRALELNPKSYFAALFVGDSYFAKKDFPNAQVWYDRAIAIDPNIETAYRYEADMLIKSGEMEKARARSIQCVIANPYTQVTWRALNYWANSNKLQLTMARINAPSQDAKEVNKGVQINIDPKSSPNEMAFSLSVWIIYSGARDDWRKEKFKKYFPNEAEYRHTLAEEADALTQAAKMLPQGVKARDLQDPNLALLRRLSDASMIEPYVLLNGADRDIALNDYTPYREQHRDQLEAYLSQFVVPPAPPKP